MKKVFTTLVLLLACTAMSFADDTWTVAGSGAAVNGGTDWAPTNEANDMATTDGTTFTLEVTGCTLEAGTTYKFKIVKNHSWDEAYPGSDKTFTVAETAIYTVVYTFNSNTKEVSDPECTKTGEAGAIAHTYTVAGSSTTLFGSSWNPEDTNNDMEETSSGVFTWTKENVLLDGNNIQFKVCEDHAWGTAFPNSNWIINSGVDEYGNGAGYYDVTITFTEDTKNIAVNIKSHFTGYYLITNEGDENTWIKGDALVDNGEGIYTLSFSKESKSFAIAPNYCLDATTGEILSWNKVVRPVTDGDDWAVNYFVNYSGNTQSVTSGGKVWAVAEGNTSTLTLTYTPAENTFTVTTNATETVTIGATGYATYSNDVKYKVEGATANFVTVSGSVATLVPLAAGAVLPNKTVTNAYGKNGGIILSGSGDVTIKPVDMNAEVVDGVSDNLLAGSGNATYNIIGDFGGEAYTGYIFAKPAEKELGFYKVDATKNTLAEHKAFLAVSTGVEAPSFIGFDFSATAIKGIETATENNMKNVFNLAGQRVINPSKGLYIVNGKKVVLK